MGMHPHPHGVAGLWKDSEVINSPGGPVVV